MEFLSEDETVIIATKGLPYSGTELAWEDISRWDRNPVFRLDDILDELYEEGKYDGTTSSPSKEDDERLKRRAFSILCRAAWAQLKLYPKVFNSVVIDALLSSTSQLDQLISFINERRGLGKSHKLLIIECRRRHMFIWKNKVVCDGEYWFKPQSWDEMEKAIEDYDGRAWDQHFDHLCGKGDLFLKRLVLDPYLDLGWNELSDSKESRLSTFAKAIEYLLTDKAAPHVVDYRKWRKQLVERQFILSNTATTTDNIINLCTTNGGDCKFIYTKDPIRRSADTNLCRACEGKLNTGEGAYTCVSCNLALHKTCAEFETDGRRLYNDRVYSPQLVYGFPAESTHACKSCNNSSKGGGGGGGFSYKCRSCIFETHLKCGEVPTVVNNPHLHLHPLSIQLTANYRDYQGPYYCESCSLIGVFCSYCCVRCNFYYHLRCAHSPREVEHEHDGYNHLMKLIVPQSCHDSDNDLQPAVFSGEKYVDQDDFWCDVCYKEIDVDAAYYCCPDCPDYVAHIYCISSLWNDLRSSIYDLIE